MASEKKIVSNFTVKVGLVLFAGCILLPISLVTTFRHNAVPRCVCSEPAVFIGVFSDVERRNEEMIGSHHSGRNEGPLLCDFSSPRSDVCELNGDVRVILYNATVVLLHPSVRPRSWRIKPHARKNDRHALAGVTEVSVSVSATSSSPLAEHAPGCTAENAAPVVVFSAGGYAGNMFHDFTDVLVPLFITARRFYGDVHLVADAMPWWLDKYRPLLRGLSRHAVVGMDRESADVLCYPRVTVGLSFHKEMSVDAARTAGGHYSMTDFTHLVRSSYGLERDTAAATSATAMAMASRACSAPGCSSYPGRRRGPSPTSAPSCGRRPR